MLRPGRGTLTGHLTDGSYETPDSERHPPPPVPEPCPAIGPLPDIYFARRSEQSGSHEDHHELAAESRNFVKAGVGYRFHLRALPLLGEGTLVAHPDLLNPEEDGGLLDA
jgi:hypothetical protein